MARPVNKQVLQSATSATTSGSIAGAGHRAWTLFVSADPEVTDLDVRLEGGPNPETWTQTILAPDTEVRIQTEDLDENGNAAISVPGFYYDFFRANLEAIEGGEVDVWLMAASNTGPGKNGLRPSETYG